MGQISETPEPLRLEGGFRAQITRHNYVSIYDKRAFCCILFAFGVTSNKQFPFFEGFLETNR